MITIILLMDFDNFSIYATSNGSVTTASKRLLQLLIDLSIYPLNNYSHNLLILY